MTAPPAAAAPPGLSVPPGFTAPVAGTVWRAGTTVTIAWNAAIGPTDGPIELVSGPTDALESAGVLARANLGVAGSAVVVIPSDLRPSDIYQIRGGRACSKRFTILKAAR